MPAPCGALSARATDGDSLNPMILFPFLFISTNKRRSATDFLRSSHGRSGAVKEVLVCIVRNFGPEHALSLGFTAMNRSIPLRDFECWVFDLDNTLYPASNGLMADVSSRMTQFVANLLGVAADEALIEQKHLFRKHGTTLRGLMEKYAVDPWSFMDFVHQVDYEQVDRSPRLAAVLHTLPRRKIVFTNASTYHAEQVLARLGIAGQFEGVFDVAAAAWQRLLFSKRY